MTAETVSRLDLNAAPPEALNGLAGAICIAVQKAMRDPDYCRRFERWKAERSARP